LPDLRWIVGNEKGGTLWLWDRVLHQSLSISIPFPPSGKNVDSSYERVGRFLSTPDCQRVVLFADSPDGSLHICSFAPEHRRILLQKTLPGMIDGIISPDGRMLAIILPNDQIFAYKEDIYVYDLYSQQLLHIFPQTTKRGYCLLTFSPDSHSLMGCKTDGEVDVFSLKTFELVARFAAHPGLSSHANNPIGGLDWSSTGYIATGGASEFEHDMSKTDYTIKIWKVVEE
jgi:WD40 repeat protein